MGVTVTTNLNQIKTRIQAGAKIAEKEVAEQVVNDGNIFVKVDQGTLRDSARVEETGGETAATWNTKYAKKQYYTGRASKDINPRASTLWADRAKAMYGKDWEIVAQNAFRKGMK